MLKLEQQGEAGANGAPAPVGADGGERSPVDETRVGLSAELQGHVAAHMIALLRARESGVVIMGDGTIDYGQVTDENRADADELAIAWERLLRLIEEVAGIAAAYMHATRAMPTDVYTASVQLATHQVEYEQRARESSVAVDAWRSLDVLTGRVRAHVAKRLVDEQNMSPTAADKAASGDEQYTAHKDMVADAAAAKERAELERTVAFEKVQTSRELLRALVSARAIVVERALRSDRTVADGPTGNLADLALSGSAPA
jgi:hypothetical protein